MCIFVTKNTTKHTTFVMVIIAKSALTRFSEKHRDTVVALMEWYDIVSEADWSNVNEVKQTFNSADYVGNERMVFNIKGNRYRLVAAVIFSIRTVYIKFIGTHAEYDKIDVETIEFNQ
jgi:mRNA interferase HigB